MRSQMTTAAIQPCEILRPWQVSGRGQGAAASLFAPFEPLEARTLMSGTTVNDYQLAMGKDASASAIVEDAGGNLFVAAAAKDASGGNHALVLEAVRQADGTLDWSKPPVVDFFLAPNSTLNGAAAFKDLVIDPTSGDLYAAGFAKDAAGVSHWVVARRSASDGAVSTSDDYQYPNASPSYGSFASGITRDAAGNVFVIGEATTTTVVKKSSTTVSHWIVRELKAGATAWETAHELDYQAGQSVHPSDIVAAPSGVYAVGYGNGHWLTERGVAGANANLSWSIVDDYQADTNYTSLATGAGVDAAGNVYVTGTANRSNGLAGKQAGSVHPWTVRRGTGAGTWSTIDSVAGAGTGVSEASGFGADAAGNLYVVGYVSEADNTTHQVVRTAPAGGGTWSTLDDYQLSAGHNAFGKGFLADDAGALYTAGRALDASNISHAIIRRIDGVNGTLFSNTMIGGTSFKSADDQQALTVAELVLA